jgi:hypothetical protein
MAVFSVLEDLGTIGDNEVSWIGGHSKGYGVVVGVDGAWCRSADILALVWGEVEEVRQRRRRIGTERCSPGDAAGGRVRFRSSDDDWSWDQIWPG